MDTALQTTNGQQGGQDVIRESLLAWECIPPDCRGGAIPKRLAGLALGMGMPVHALEAIRDTSSYKDDLMHRQTEWFENKLPEVRGALFLSAMMPGREGHNDRKLFMQLKGLLIERMEVNSNIRLEVLGQGRHEVMESLEQALADVKETINREFEDVAGITEEGSGYTIVEEVHTEDEEKEAEVVEAAKKTGPLQLQLE